MSGRVPGRPHQLDVVIATEVEYGLTSYTFMLPLPSRSIFMYAQLIWFCGAPHRMRVAFDAPRIGHICPFMFVPCFLAR